MPGNVFAPNGTIRPVPDASRFLLHSVLIAVGLSLAGWASKDAVCQTRPPQAPVPEPVPRARANPTRDAEAVRVVSTTWKEGFESNRPAWQVVPRRSGVPIRFSQKRNHELAREGRVAAELRIAPGQSGRLVRLVYPLPPSQVLDELTFSLWVRSNRNGLRLALRIRFPGQVNPGAADAARLWRHLHRGSRVEAAPMPNLLRPSARKDSLASRPLPSRADRGSRDIRRRRRP